MHCHSGCEVPREGDQRSGSSTCTRLTNGVFGSKRRAVEFRSKAAHIRFRWASLKRVLTAASAECFSAMGAVQYSVAIAQNGRCAQTVRYVGLLLSWSVSQQASGSTCLLTFLAERERQDGDLNGAASSTDDGIYKSRVSILSRLSALSD